MILFYGASFTRTYANYASFHIRPKSFARLYQLRHEKEMRKAGNRKSDQE
jgi:hypothetical protein